MKISFRHSKADPRIEPRSEPIAAMIKRVADEHRQRGAPGPALTPAGVVGQAALPAASMLLAPVIAPAVAPAIAPVAPMATATSMATELQSDAQPEPRPQPRLTASTADAVDATDAIGTGADLTTCAKGHRFARLSDHPAMDGVAACPHCMAKTLGDYRKIFAAIVRPVRYE